MRHEDVLSPLKMPNIIVDGVYALQLVGQHFMAKNRCSKFRGEIMLNREDC
jgi:hypothetical protein